MKTVVVSGSNRSIGLAIVEKLAERDEALAIYCGSRAGSKLPSVEEKLNSKSKVYFVKLDTSDESTIKTVVEQVKADYGKLDVLINNAGVNWDNDGYTAETATKTMDVNYRGNLMMSEAFAPIMPKGGRIVTLSSGASQRVYMNENEAAKKLRARLEDPSLTIDQLSQMILDYEKTVADGPDKEKDGWPHDSYLPAYSVSKVAVNVMTRILAKEHPDLLVNCCCPGAVDTEMGRKVPGIPPKTPEEGARIPVHLGLEDIGNVTGHYWANDAMSMTGVPDGPMPDWFGKGIKK